MYRPQYNPAIAYSLEARIIHKKDQLEELSATGTVIPAPIIDEVRTGQQFLIKLQLSRSFQHSALALDHTPRFPAIRVGRREAINTAGEPRHEPEQLTLQIIVYLVKSGQIRKGACAKCCHKFGPSSPILLLLDPLPPSSSEPASFAHIDTSTGAATLLAKVICSSTDHGERGNKDRYIFEFRLKRTSTMPVVVNGGQDSLEEEGETVAHCVTTPIMCSGHHKAKRAYPLQRPTKVPKGIPTPKIKVIKRHKSAPNIAMPPASVIRQGLDIDDTRHSSGSIDSSGNSNLNSGLSFLPNGQTPPPPTMPEVHDRLNSSDMQYEARSSSSTSVQHQSYMPQAPLEPLHPHQPQQNPRIMEVRPDQGPVRKTIDVVLRGLSFREGMVPYFGCFPAQSIVIETANLILCKAPESPLPGTVNISMYDNLGNSFANLAQFTYTDDSETELLILQLQLRLAHRALEYLHTQATGQKGNAVDILRDIPGLSASPRSSSGMGLSAMMTAASTAEENSFDTTAQPLEETDVQDIEMPLMTLNEVEESILVTLDQLPYEMDISMQLQCGSNLLHLAILLGFTKLSLRLIEEGCDIEAQDQWRMTPLKYAVVKGNESIARALVIAGASSSGASSPLEFYTSLPFLATPTLAMFGYLSVSCDRAVLGAPSAHLSNIISIHETDEMSSLNDTDDEDEMSMDGDIIRPDSSISIHHMSQNQENPRVAAVPTTPLPISQSPPAPVPSRDDPESMTKLANVIHRIHVHHGLAPLDQQDLPPLHIQEVDGSVTINTKVMKADSLATTPDATTTIAADGGATTASSQAHPESGYHSGVSSEVQERLKTLHMATLPSQNVQMVVLFKKLTPSSPTIGPVVDSASTSSSNLSVQPSPELFRTGDTFGIEIRLFTTSTKLSSLSEEHISLPREYFGVRFPHEMVRRKGGRQASILTQMTYILNLSIELGKQGSKKSSSSDRSNVGVSAKSIPEHYEEDEEGHKTSFGDGIPLYSACKSCAKFLHEHKKLSPSRRSSSDPTQYPIVQFSIPGGTSTVVTTNAGAVNTNNSGVVELRDGACDVNAKVNCSSFHHLLQRERTKLSTAIKAQQKKLEQGQEQAQETASASASASASLSKEEATSTAAEAKQGLAAAKEKMAKALAELEDPGYVFKFELVHPELKTVVAQFETRPILFQSFARGRN